MISKEGAAVHYVIGLLGAIGTVLFVLYRMQRAGLDLNSFNPFLWYRRAKWRRRYATKPLYTLEEPMDVAALLMLVTARCEGEVSAEQKAFLLSCFENEFHLSENEASALLISTAHLLRHETDVTGQLDKVLEASKQQFTPEQVKSTVDLMEKISWLDGASNAYQAELIAKTKTIFEAVHAPRGKWN